MTEDIQTYPLLTIQTLLTLEKRVDGRTLLEDCRLIDHYVESTGNPGAVLEEFSRRGAMSFEEFIEIQQNKTGIRVQCQLNSTARSQALSISLWTWSTTAKKSTNSIISVGTIPHYHPPRLLTPLK
jgi:hypothetical protein